MIVEVYFKEQGYVIGTIEVEARLRYHGIETGNSSIGSPNITRYIATIEGEEVYAYDRGDARYPTTVDAVQLSAELRDRLMSIIREKATR